MGRKKEGAEVRKKDKEVKVGTQIRKQVKTEKGHLEQLRKEGRKIDRKKSKKEQGKEGRKEYQ